MIMRTHIASVVGQATNERWGQVLHTPFAYGVVEINADNARQKGIEALAKLSKLFDSKPVSLSALEDFADEVKSPDIVSLVILVPVDHVLYLVCRGKGSVYIRREEKLARLIQDEQSLSGQVKPGDTIIAATSGFVQALNEQDILGVFDHLTPSEVAEKLTLLLHQHEGGDGGSALIFHVDAVVEEKEIEPSIPPKRNPSVIKKLLPKIRHMVRNFSVKKSLPFILIGLFGISVVLGLLHQRGIRTNNKTMQVVTEAQHIFDEGVALADINPVKGRERLNEAKDMLAPLVAEKPKTDEARAAKILYDQVLEHITRALHITEADPQLFFDVSLLKAGGTITDASLFEDVFGLLDANGKTAFTLDALSKNGSVIGGGEIFAGSTNIASYSDTDYVMTTKGIHAVSITDKKTKAEIIKAPPEWGNIIDGADYGGNLYLLDSAKSRIWKYVAAEHGFTELREYLNPDFFPDLSTTTNMAIDGSIWLGTTKGEILRFTQGKENSFTPQGAEPPLGKNLQIYVADDVKMVYVLDIEQKRVVVFDKDGLYISQYVWKSDITPSQFFVSEKLAKIFLLSAGKLYSIDIK